ncbi:MAG TPA: MMPL family transporter [Actinomycetota bacterium]|nr:MMPL family transporter [Actinomycetota bacterium]
MRRLSAVILGRPRMVLAMSSVALLVSGALGAGVIDRLSSGGFEVEGSPSGRAIRHLEDRFGTGEVDLVLLVSVRDGRGVDDRVVSEAGHALTAQLAGEAGVEEAYSYWSTGLAPLRGERGDKALVLARLEGSRDEITRRLEALIPRYEGSTGPLDVRASGYGAVYREVSRQIERDLRRAEMVVVPVTGLLLLFVFRSAVAAALPLAVGALAMVGTLLVLRVVTAFTEISVFALNMTMAMSLGLGIDYSLFIVTRYREELALGHPPPAAVRRTLETAGRTVVYSAITVAASLVALLVFPLPFLRSFGIAGIAIVTIAGAASVLTLPALLTVLGSRIDRWSVRPVRAPVPGRGGWHRLAMTVMRRPLPVATVATALLVLLGLPFLRMELGMPDPRVLPPGAPAREVVDDFTRNFSGGEAFPVFVLLRGGTPPPPGEVDAYATSLSSVPGVARVDTWTGSYTQGARIFSDPAFGSGFVRGHDLYLRVVAAPSVQPFSPRGEQLVQDIRSTPSPSSDGVEVAGQAAAFVDAKRTLFDRLPIALAIIAAATMLVLFLAFGSLLVPVKAVVLNLLSLTATFGAMVWVFQDGHLSGLLGFTPREAVDLFNPILMFAIAFGISMDYEVFLLSRIREEYDRTGDNQLAVATGLERTGRLVTAAAMLLAVVFLAQVSSGISIIKMFGLGLALAILVDAFVVRATLVPAFMRIAGGLNWWLPAGLRRVHDRFGFRETGGPAEHAVGEAEAATPLAAAGATDGSETR